MIAEKNHSLPILKFNAPGVFIFAHKSDLRLIYCSKSHDMLGDVTRIMECLFLKDDLDINPLEVHLRKHPAADDWSVIMFAHTEEHINLEWVKCILQYESLHPKGLNEELEIYCKEDWITFIEWAQNY